MANSRKIEEFDYVLVVEGYGDLLFYAEMLEEVGKNEEVFIKQIEGIFEYETKLETLINPGFLASKSAIAFIFDADTNPQARRSSFEALLTRLTGQAVVNGQWTEGSPKIGLFIVPGGDQVGEIETLVWNSWASDGANDQQKQCIESYVACMEGAGAAAHSAPKGLIGALLAIKSDEDPRLGPGARDNVFDLKRLELFPLKTFLSGF